MGTSWIEVISNSAMLFIDDVRLQDDVAVNPAQFFRRMTLYMNAAIPLLARPPELQTYLLNGMEAPAYDDFSWVSTTASTGAETVVETGITGFSLFSCVIRQVDAAENVTLIPYTDATYDPETGNVTFGVQSAAGIEYSLDFYNDGSFSADLTQTQKRLLGLAIACAWDERFSRNWLNMQMKIHDSSFETVNESNYIQTVTSRLKTNRAMLNDELWKYEQDYAYRNLVAKGNKPHIWP